METTTKGRAACNTARSAPLFPLMHLPVGAELGPEYTAALSTPELRDIVAGRRHPFEFFPGAAP